MSDDCRYYYIPASDRRRGTPADPTRPGPLASLYAAACGRVFGTPELAAEHSRRCQSCLALRRTLSDGRKDNARIKLPEQDLEMQPRRPRPASRRPGGPSRVRSGRRPTCGGSVTTSSRTGRWPNSPTRAGLSPTSSLHPAR